MRLGDLRSALPFVLVFVAMGTSAYAADNMIVNVVAANAGDTNVPVVISATSDLPYQGFSVAATYPTLRLDCVSADVTGTVTETISPGGIPDFFGVTIDDVLGEVVVGVIFETQPGAPVEIPASPAVPNDILNLRFDIDGLAPPIGYDIELINGVGDPPVSNVFSTDGQSIFPTLTPGQITVNNQNSFYFDPISTIPGADVTAFVMCDHVQPLQGYQIALLWDRTKLLLQSNTFSDSPQNQCLNGINPDMVTGTDALSLIEEQGETIELLVTEYIVNIMPNMDFLAVSVITDFCSPLDGQVVPPGSGQSILRLRYQASGSLQIGQCADLQFVDGLGNPPKDNFVIVDGFTFGPILTDGQICATDATVFRRADANGDSNIDVADAIFIIQYLFSAGPTPGCLDAADSNDDGLLDVSDVIYIIQYNFAGGAQPPSPFPTCGVDPTDTDFLDCLIYNGC